MQRFNATVLLEGGASEAPIGSTDGPGRETKISAVQYRVEEMKLLRSEIELQIKTINDNERDCVIAVAFVIYFATLVREDVPTEVRVIISSLPLLIAFLGSLRAFSIRSLINVMDRYLLVVEKEIDPNSQFWVTHYKASVGFWRNCTRLVFWIAMLLFGVVFFSLGSGIVGASSKGN